MRSDILIRRLDNTDLNLYQCGRHDCEPGHAYGPAVRDHFLIHYIKSGGGTFCSGGTSFTLGKGNGFLIVPNEISYYQASRDDPWRYSWVGFNGLKAEGYLKAAGLSAESPVFTYDGDALLQRCIDEMLETQTLQKGRELRLLGLLYRFLSLLTEANGGKRAPDETGTRRDDYVRRAVSYIAMNYAGRLTIADVAKYVGLERSYLGSVFRRQVGLSMQEYLLTYRLDRACALMESPGLSIGDIARSVGYPDPLLFSKLFKKHKGVSPSQYRSAIQAP